MVLDNRLHELERLINKVLTNHGQNYLTQELIREFQTKLIYCSSLIEEAVISEQRVKEIADDYPDFSHVILKTREESQAAGQMEALGYIELIVREKQPFDSYTIKEIHRLILYRGWPDIAGKFRQENLEMKGTSLIPTHFSKINEKLFFLDHFIEDNLNKTKTLIAQIEFVSRVHHEITHIHPFRDGNGRVARIFTNLVFRHFGLPYVLVPKVNAREDMRDALRAADSGDFSKLIEMNTNLLINSFEMIDAFYCRN